MVAAVRWWVLAAFAVVMMLAVMGVKKMVVQTSFDDYFIKGDPMLVKTDGVQGALRQRLFCRCIDRV